MTTLIGKTKEATKNYSVADPGEQREHRRHRSSASSCRRHGDGVVDGRPDVARAINEGDNGIATTSTSSHTSTATAGPAGSTGRPQARPEELGRQVTCQPGRLGRDLCRRRNGLATGLLHVLRTVAFTATARTRAIDHL
jgi:hypothetical protein